MKKNSLKSNLVKLFISFSLFTTTLAYGQAFTENFDNINTLVPGGWFLQNNSSPVGLTGWFQGNTGVFSAYNGPADAYLAANYNNTSGVGTISNWAVMPNVTLHNGDVITFRTRTEPASIWPDRLELRMSTNGASTNVGVLATDVGDFTTLLVSVNPALAQNVYPASWTQYSATITGLAGPTSGRFALRYFVTNAGPSGSNSDYIGIDNVDYIPNPCNPITISPAALPNGSAGQAYNQALSQTGGTNPCTYAVTLGSLPPGLSLSAAGVISGVPTATGNYSFEVTVTDLNGCTGTQNYTIIIDCALNGASLSLNPVCDNAGLITLSGGSPAGGTYSGTNVSGNTFDPSGGSQTITYDVTDAYGCPQSASALQQVNTAPVVTLDPFVSICNDAPLQALTGGLPAGGTYSGIGVSGNTFDPQYGTQDITYVYADANNCKDSATQTQDVIPAPSVIVAQYPDLCSNSAPYTLFGGVPQGGVFSGPGVVNGVFTQTGAGTYPITYTYSIGSCASAVTLDLTVNSAENSALAGTGNTVESQFITDVPAITEVRYEPDCDLMATLNPSGPTPISGNTTVKVVLDDAVNTYGGKPYLQRHYSILSVSNPVNATGTVTLYAYQSEFNAYNAVASGMGLPLLPTGVDNGNIRVTVFRNLTTTPDPTVPAVTVAPTATWDAAHSWWKLSLPVTQLGGFYIHTGDLPLDVSHMSNTAGGSLAVYPNPAKDKVNVSVSGTMKGNAQLYVSDLTGRVLIQVPMDNDKAVVDMSSLAAGMYMVTYSDDERKETLKITKQQ